MSKFLLTGDTWTSAAHPKDPWKAKVTNRCPVCKSNVLFETEEEIKPDAPSPKERKLSRTKPPENNALEHSTSDSSIGG